MWQVTLINLPGEESVIVRAGVALFGEYDMVMVKNCVFIYT